MQIIIFFTYNVKIEDLISKKLILREMNYWKALFKNNCEVTLVTYGLRNKKIEKFLKKKVSSELKIFWLSKFKFTKPLIFLGELRYICEKILSHKEKKIVRTNQVKGWLPAFILSKICKIPFFVRFGFITSQLHLTNKRYLKYCFSFLSETLAIILSDGTLVCGEDSYKILKKRLPIKKNLKLSFNYIDLYKKKVYPNRLRRINQALFVGRLEHEKNPELAIIAALQNNYHLKIAGEGSLSNYLKKKYKFYKTIEFLGLVDPKKLIILYEESQFLFVPSFNEGMPKAVLEAACNGCIPVGMSAPGLINLCKKFGYQSKLIMNSSFLKNINKIRKTKLEILKKKSQINILKSRSDYSLDKLVDLELRFFKKYYEQN